MNNILLVFIGGGLGSVVRYLLGLFMQKSIQSSIPWHTLAANIIASAILGFVVATIALRPGNFEHQRLFIGIGFCGGLSTFSTFTMEGFEMFRAGNIGLALTYTLVSVVVCLIAFWAAWMLQK
ncbi:MAG: fluoride efflux transporter CrcB [Bacteroidetes bacterium]|nr:fluoride efflux transporter CrcB [Bacteroidota bacterium]MBK9402512.1 fluoride efflux transporter CrcB [Bacteroidota bacterium]